MQQTIHFSRWLGALYRRTNTFMKESFKGLGLGFPDSNVLIICSIHEGISQEEISSKLAVDKAVTAKSVKWLEEQGLIRREADEADLRIKRVYPTPKGIAIKKRMDQYMETWTLKVVESLTVEELNHLFPALRKMSLTARQVPIPELMDEHGIPRSG